MPTGLFTPMQNKFFDSITGAYTSMTDAEVDKRTFNVKAVIRDMVIGVIGEKIVRAFNSDSNIASFQGCDKIPDFKGQTFNLVFKYSKPAPKREMTIYLSENKGISRRKLVSGNIWFVYFKESDTTPWFGIMSPAEWSELAGSESTNYFDDEVEIEESRNLNYTFDVSKANILETNSPKSSKKLVKAVKSKRQISVKDLDMQLANHKTKGTKGEEIVMEIERRKLATLGRTDLIKKIKWISSEKDGYGYDIVSFDILPNGTAKDIVIEVKTTSCGINTPFNISLNEVNVSKTRGNSYYIYRIYNLDESGSNIKYYKVNGAVEDNFDLSPIAFKAVKR